MKEKVDELYEKYLEEKLDCIFDDNANGHKVDNYDAKRISTQENDEYPYGYKLIVKDEKTYYIDKEGKLLFQEGFDYGTEFSYGVAIVQKNNKYSIINKDGEFLTEWSKKEPEILNNNPLFMYVGKETICKKVELGDYKVKKQVARYELSNGKTTIKLKYKPVKTFDDSHVLCVKDQFLYLYSVKDDKYTNLGYSNTFEFKDNMIFTLKLNDNTVRLIHSGKVLDITKYYQKKLKNKEVINISSSDIPVLTKDEFHFENMDEIDKFMEEERKKNRAIREEQNKKEELEKEKETVKEIIAKKEKTVEDKKRIKEEQEKLSKEIISMIHRLNDMYIEGSPIQRFPIKNIFVKVDDHLEIKEEYKDILKYIDLSDFSFEGVKLEGIDFSFCNIDSLNPEKVYNKSLKGCNFDRVHFFPLTNFEGVDVTGCTFSDDDNDLTMDVINVTLKNAIYDDTTTYNGTPIKEYFGKKL